MKILFISTWFPYPLDNGYRIRLYHLLCSLAEKHEVHLASFLSPGKNVSGTSLGELSVELIRTISRDPFSRNKKNKFLAHFSMKPRDVLLLYDDEMQRTVNELHRQHAYDLIIASTIHSIPYVEGLKDIPLVLEEHNFTTKWMEERYHGKGNLKDKIAGWITWQKCKYYEKQAFPKFQAVSMVSETDRNSVIKNIPSYKGYLEVIPNGVDLKSRTFGSGIPIPDTLVYNGSLSYSANLDAMRFFIFEILPLIWKEKPDTRLVITGDINGVDLKWIPSVTRIQLTGYLEDVRPTIANSWACVVPLRDGGGTRLKILESMALGTPVISTTKGAEGIDVEFDKDLLIADEPDVFAKKCIMLMNDPILRNDLSKKARIVVEQKYGWDKIGLQFRNLIERVYNDHSS